MSPLRILIKTGSLVKRRWVNSRPANPPDVSNENSLKVMHHRPTLGIRLRVVPGMQYDRTRIGHRMSNRKSDRRKIHEPLGPGKELNNKYPGKPAYQPSYSQAPQPPPRKTAVQLLCYLFAIIIFGLVVFHLTSGLTNS